MGKPLPKCQLYWHQNPCHAHIHADITVSLADPGRYGRLGGRESGSGSQDQSISRTWPNRREPRRERELWDRCENEADASIGAIDAGCGTRGVLPSPDSEPWQCYRNGSPCTARHTIIIIITLFSKYSLHLPLCLQEMLQIDAPSNVCSE